MVLRVKILLQTQPECKLTHHMIVFQNSILAIAGDDEIVRMCDVGTEKWVCEFKAHETRYVNFPCFYFKYVLCMSERLLGVKVLGAAFLKRYF